MDSKMSFLPLIVVVDFGLDLHLSETVGAVLLFQDGNIVSQKRGAETSMRKEAGSGLNLHVGLKLCHVEEVLVARNIEQDELVDRAGIDLVDHAQSVWVV